MIILPSLFLFFSCVYFNTFYNAKIAYKDALRIINLMDYTESSIPSEAKRLLDLSIANSRVVLEKYPKSKYVEQAYYLLASSMFLKEDYISSKEYLNTLIDNYPEGEYYNEANLRLASIHVREENISLADNIIQHLKSDYKLNKYELYLLSTIYAEIDIINKNIESAYNNYENAIKNASSDSQRIKIYNKLIQLSEKEKDYEKLLIFIDGLYKNSSLDSDKKELKLLSLEYNKRLKKYNYLITEIQDMLNQSLFEDKRLFLSVELAKTYYRLEDYAVAEELILEIVDIYSKKNETAEAYYYLAQINIKNDFNLEIIKDLLNKSKAERSSSKYGKLSKELIRKLESLEDISYEYSNSISDENIDNNKMLRSDSLLFNMGQIYYFDFNQVDSAISKHIELVDRFPDSKFSPKSLFVLSILDSSNQSWEEKLLSNYPDKNFEESTYENSFSSSYSEEYYRAINLLELGFYEDAYPILKEINLNNNNKESLFYLGYINEVYTGNIGEMIGYYVQYINQGENEDNKNSAKETLAAYYYIFNQNLLYLQSKKILSDYLYSIPSDSLLEITVNDNFFRSMFQDKVAVYSDDSLRLRYSNMKILNQSWSSFKKQIKFIDANYQLFSNSDSTSQSSDYLISSIESDQNIFEINQITDYLSIYDDLMIEGDTDTLNQDGDINIPSKSMPFENLGIENMNLDRLDLFKK